MVICKGHAFTHNRSKVIIIKWWLSSNCRRHLSTTKRDSKTVGIRFLLPPGSMEEVQYASIDEIRKPKEESSRQSVAAAAVEEAESPPPLPAPNPTSQSLTIKTKAGEPRC